MQTISLDLYKAQNGLDSYALAPSDPQADNPGLWLALKGFGTDFEKVWTLELQSCDRPDVQTIPWEAVLERAIEAYHLSDPIITDFEWPSSINA